MKKHNRGPKKETTSEATAWPQGENVVELGEGVPRVSSRDGLRGAFARHSLQVCQRTGQAAQCPDRAICTTGD